MSQKHREHKPRPTSITVGNLEFEDDDNQLLVTHIPSQTILTTLDNVSAIALRNFISNWQYNRRLAEQHKTKRAESDPQDSGSGCS